MEKTVKTMKENRLRQIIISVILIAAIIFLARHGYDKVYIKQYVIDEFGYDLSRTCDEIRPTYHHVESCQQTVPEAITAFLEGTDFEDILRNAVSLGGDCDTLTDIACAMGEALYEIPEEYKTKCRDYLEPEMIKVIDRFTGYLNETIEESRIQLR